MKNSLSQISFFIIISVVVGFGSNWFRNDSISLLAEELKTATSTDLLDVDISNPVLMAISIEQAREFYDGNVIFVDARDLEYFQEGHISGAWNSDNFSELIFKLDSLQGKDESIVTYCDGDECGSSEDLAYDLQDAGFTKLFVFVGGWSEWNQDGLSIEK